MLNVGGGELLIIFLVALVVLGPTKLPEVARQAGKIYSEFRKISSGFQREFREAMRDPVGNAVRDVTEDATPQPIGAGDPYDGAEKTSFRPRPRAEDEAASGSSPSDLPDADTGGSDDGGSDDVDSQRSGSDAIGPNGSPGDEPVPADDPPMSSDR